MLKLLFFFLAGSKRDKSPRKKSPPKTAAKRLNSKEKRASTSSEGSYTSVSTGDCKLKLVQQKPERSVTPENIAKRAMRGRSKSMHSNNRVPEDIQDAKIKHVLPSKIPSGTRRKSKENKEEPAEKRPRPSSPVAGPSTKAVEDQYVLQKPIYKNVLFQGSGERKRVARGKSLDARQPITNVPTVSSTSKRQKIIHNLENIKTPAQWKNETKKIKIVEAAKNFNPLELPMELPNRPPVQVAANLTPPASDEEMQDAPGAIEVEPPNRLFRMQPLNADPIQPPEIGGLEENIRFEPSQATRPPEIDDLDKNWPTPQKNFARISPMPSSLGSLYSRQEICKYILNFLVLFCGLSFNSRFIYSVRC